MTISIFQRRYFQSIVIIFCKRFFFWFGFFVFLLAPSLRVVPYDDLRVVSRWGKIKKTFLVFLKGIWFLVKYNHFSFYLTQKIHWEGLNLASNLPLKNLTPKMLSYKRSGTDLYKVQSCNSHVFEIISMSFKLIETNLANWKFRWCWIAWTIIVVFTIIVFIGQRLKYF